jgi:hypothetical protein
MRQPGTYREAELRFGHPYAVVALTTAGSEAASPWHGLPVFSAWISEPDDASEDSAAEESAAEESAAKDSATA